MIIYEQQTKPITSAKGRGRNGHRFLCVPHRSWGFNVCNKIRQTCVSKVIVFCVTPIVPERFHDSIKYQCPGVIVPSCRRFWRALICIQKHDWWMHYCNNLARGSRCSKFTFDSRFSIFSTQFATRPWFLTTPELLPVPIGWTCKTGYACRGGRP